jgi:hypothetical protein
MTTQLYYKDGDGNYVPVHKYNIRTVWRPMDTIPKTGEEVLVVYTKQGNVKRLVVWDELHGYWVSGGKPVLGLEANADYWYRITDPVR